MLAADADAIIYLFFIDWLIHYYADAMPLMRDAMPLFRLAFMPLADIIAIAVGWLPLICHAIFIDCHC